MPTAVPSRYTLYPATPTLSEAAGHESAMLDAVAVSTVGEPGALGAVVSGHVAVAAARFVRGERFPMPSYASTPTT